MGDKINLGVIGCGNIAKNALLPDAAKIEEFNLYAFADVAEEKAKELCEEYKGEYYTTDVDKLLNDSNVDAVLVLTLPDAHVDLAKKFLGAGKHVFLQKPVAVTYEQCRDLVKAEEASEAICMCAFCYRLSPLMAQIKEEIPYAQMQMARMMVNDMAGAYQHYIDNKATGGPMLELAIHNADLVYYIAGSKPVRVSAFGGNMGHPNDDMVDNMVMNIDFENGAVASLISADCGGNDFSRKWFYEAYGHRKSFIIDGFRTMHIVGPKGTADPVEIEYKSGIGLDRDMEVFKDSVLKGESAIPAREGVVSTILLLKGYDSITSGQTVDVNLDDILS